ncbi:MAG: hypothetical protein GWN67_08540 [Phycisphaerae bacterium]|nr:hypothetical protein [Phycisphaerae bacterium]NIW72657.1 hypothetical protein [candidate division KSB1 bacterium]NIP52134.1 hypothetical protein [Phycisphaerae bacterium]NIS51140.1 hypothetical protein [Phycisphaerae bacterium]NIU08810.1 hypothetical protein [Phycisphaerae bacterium]
MIKFYCKHCGQQIGVPVGSAGSEARCPRCKKTVFIPEAGSTEAVADESTLSGSKGEGKYAGFDRALFDIPQEEESASQADNQVGMSKEEFEEFRRNKAALEEYEAMQIGKRKLPALIDVFLYPTSFWGLVYLVLFIGITLFLEAMGKILPYQFSCLYSIKVTVIKVLVVLFMYWYFAECVRDSADGGLRAPRVIGDTPGFWDMFRQMVDIIVCIVIFFAPFFLYVLITKKAGIIFWFLLIYAVFFFPMVLLSFVVFDSIAGLNPRLIYKSILKTFWPYCGLVLFFIAAGLLVGVLGYKSSGSVYLFILARCVGFYLLFVAAHLLGRFYWKYQERLKWDVRL